MLQIITGKFFSSDDLYRTRHRHVLYTNYRPLREIETPVGSLLPADVRRDVASVIYDVEERLEARLPDGRPSILVSVGGDSLAEDFAAVVSFALDVTCTPDLDLARRLTQASHSPLGVPRLPREYVDRVFDREVAVDAGDGERLRAFVAGLVALERSAYETAMRAIRRFATGLHRVGDDLSLAYTLLVASIESLAQQQPVTAPAWDDVPEQKRRALDRALAAAAPDVADRVRAAVVASEHRALTRRYREFAIAHLPPSFFREEAIRRPAPVRKSDLAGVLERAYEFRSKNVHTLRELPRIIAASPSRGDVTDADGAPALTVAGLARIARRVIRAYVERAPTTEREAYHYWAHLPNVVRVSLAPEMWIGQAGGYSPKTARRYLAGFLSELAGVLQGEPDAKVTDIRSVLGAVEGQIRGLAKPEQRLPMVALYVLWHLQLAEDAHRPRWRQRIERYLPDLDAPSVESMAAHVVTGQAHDWSADAFEATRQQYLAQRYRRHGLRLPTLFEIAATLTAAEAYRREGSEPRAQELVRHAVEDLPGYEALRAF